MKADSTFTKMATTIKIIAKDIIRPSSPTPPNLRHHKLSFLDRQQYPIHIPLVLFFGQNSSSQNSDRFPICHQLKRSLSDALTKFYPLAGKTDDGDLFVDCNDSGALFVEAQVQARLSQAIERTTNENIAQYLPTKPYIFTDILLAVQVNFFECGGIAIGACISHKVADAMSFVTFLTAWAATCRGETQIMIPNFDLGYRFFPPVHFHNSPPSQEIVEYYTQLRKKLVVKRFVFDKERLLQLKALAHGVKDPTRVEVVSAFIYKQFVKINRAKVNPKRMFAFSYSVNLRPRMRLPDQLPGNESVFGNLSQPSSSTILTYEKVEKFYDLVSAMRLVIRKFKDDEKESVQNKVASANDDFMALLHNLDVVHLHFTSWCKFPLYEVDYGWGKPLAFSTQAVPTKNAVRLLDTTDGEGIQALVTLLDEDAALLPDELLSLENHDYSK